MTGYNQGDVVLVPFPFTDLSTRKQRPAVVLSGQSYNMSHPDAILAPVTSRAAYSADEVTLADWASAGLLKPSVVKPILASCEASLIIRRLGTLSAPDLAQVRMLFARIYLCVLFASVVKNLLINHRDTKTQRRTKYFF